MDTPVDKVALAELPDRFGHLAFMFPKPQEPVFGNHQEMVTRQSSLNCIGIDLEPRFR